MVTNRLNQVRDGRQSRKLGFRRFAPVYRSCCRYVSSLELYPHLAAFIADARDRGQEPGLPKDVGRIMIQSYWRRYGEYPRATADLSVRSFRVKPAHGRVAKAWSEAEAAGSDVPNPHTSARTPRGSGHPVRHSEAALAGKYLRRLRQCDQ